MHAQKPNIESVSNRLPMQVRGQLDYKFGNCYFRLQELSSGRERSAVGLQSTVMRNDHTVKIRGLITKKVYYRYCAAVKGTRSSTALHPVRPNSPSSKRRRLSAIR